MRAMPGNILNHPEKLARMLQVEYSRKIGVLE
jgi:hypothetical protein